VALALCAGVGACAGCRTDDGPPPPPVTAAVDSVASCTPIFEFRGETLDSVRITLIEQIWADAYNIAQYHDCQRLARYEGNDLVYGPEAKVFGIGLDTFELPGPSQPAVLVAAISVDASTGDPGYPDLNLLPGLNCVYVARVGATFRAQVAQEPDLPCEPQAPSPGPGDLHVVRSASGGSPADIPPVTRWDEGQLGTRIQPSIGFRCGTGWCEAGPASIVHSQPYNPGGNAQERIKGWYDEQFLGEKPGPTNPLRRGLAKATLIPDPLLGTYDDDAFNNQWIRTATIVLHSPSNYYAAKYGLAVPGSYGMYLTRDPAGNAWSGEIRDSNGNRVKTFSKVEQLHRHPPPSSPPAVARWGWRDDDEDFWVRCGYGCCHAE
jgi:hypothetical protein